MERSDQAAVLCDASPLRKTGIWDVVLGDDERLGLTVMKSLLLVNSSSVTPPGKHRAVRLKIRDLPPDLILLKDSLREFFSDLFVPDTGFSSTLSLTRLTVALQYRFVIS